MSQSKKKNLNFSLFLRMDFRQTILTETMNENLNKKSLDYFH